MQNLSIGWLQPSPQAAPTVHLWEGGTLSSREVTLGVPPSLGMNKAKGNRWTLQRPGACSHLCLLAWDTTLPIDL